MFLILSNFIRSMSKCGIHLYSMRKHAAWTHMQSQVNAVCTAPGTISQVADACMLQSSDAFVRMNSSHLRARSSKSWWWRMHCKSCIMVENLERNALHWSTILDSCSSSSRRMRRSCEDSVAQQEVIPYYTTTRHNTLRSIFILFYIIYNLNITNYKCCPTTDWVTSLY